MDPDVDFPFLPPASQASSHFPLPEPVTGATLYELEVARRERLRRRGRIRTGCVEIDEAVLSGGFERGSVVGISAEDVDFGLLVGLQTAARAVVFGTARRAAIVTTLAAQAILPTLRDVIRAQVQTKLGPAANHQQPAVNAEVRRCLELISVSRVFDIEGLWEVIDELVTPAAPATAAAAAAAAAATTTTTVHKEDEAVENGITETPLSSPLSLLDSPSWDSAEEIRDEASAEPKLSPTPPRIERAEVGDSEDDDEVLEFSQSPSSPLRQPPLPSSPSPLPPLPSIPSPTPVPPQESKPAEEKSEEKKEEVVETAEHIPDLILVTHFSALLANLFTRAADNKGSAHTTLQLLSSHLRDLARSASSSPLIMLLNSTTTTTSPSNPTSTTTPAPAPGPAAKNRPLEPTLRSIFHAGAPGSRRNKPAFGVTFAQFLDLHVLCTRVPRTRADAGALLAGAREVRYGWVVEVLLDEVGVWDEDGGKEDEGRQNGGGGRSREQRWGAVDVRGGVVLVDSFPGSWSK
ncbi:hypothetical protein F4818DRAFT_239165 [Hypoxylon cercidicola]|nr:hypothetical protein F4818DRAFT_239165 [Hypoxylon cercidicola]